MNPNYFDIHLNDLLKLLGFCGLKDLRGLRQVNVLEY